MRKKIQDYELNETDYFIWCLLNQLYCNDEKINKTKKQLIKLLEAKMFDKNNIKGDIKDTKLILRFYY